jgi:hypothetical protein
LCWPDARLEIGTEATPVALKATESPNEVPSEANCTVPFPPAGVTVAVNVTDCCGSEGLTEDVTAMDVGILLTVTASGFDVAALKFGSPTYLAVMLNVPAAGKVAFAVAAPPLSAPAFKIWVPFRNCTLPDAVAGVTLALNVTDWPTFTEVAGDVSETVAFALLTVNVIGADVLPPVWLSPAYEAVTVYVPVGGDTA